MLRASVAAGRAYLALAKRDTTRPRVQLLMTTTDTLHECWHDNRVTLVKLLVATGRYREAGKRLERRWPGTTGCSNGFDDVLWTMQRARVFEHSAGERKRAAEYAFVADAWRTADPELQPYVRESRVAMARLKAVGDGRFRPGELRSGIEGLDCHARAKARDLGRGEFLPTSTLDPSLRSG